MSDPVPRMRMFAGPNGSGKSILKTYLPPHLLGVYLNADEIEARIQRDGLLRLNEYGIDAGTGEVEAFFQRSEFLSSAGLGDGAREVRFLNGCLDFSKVDVNSYFASATVDFLRQKLFERRMTFTFETVMSHPGKVSLLKMAQGLGYRTYLYFVATDDPIINVSRVANRVALGGHAVPSEKVVLRYYRSLALLLDAIRSTNRAYIFDNSTESSDRRLAWIAEVTSGRDLELKTDRVPAWFQQAVLEAGFQSPP